jgi:predicted phage terminase large subunit-like protein
MLTTLTPAEMRLIDKSALARVRLSKLSFFHFLIIYHSSLFALDPAEFHIELIEVLEDGQKKYVAVIGYRGCAKSTLLELYALWELLTGRNKFAAYVRSTIDAAHMSLANIQDIIVNNAKLRNDFAIQGAEKTVRKFDEKWTTSQITVNGCTLVAKSRGQKIRGAKFGQERIGLIIGDDIEDVEDADTAEKRKKTRRWFFTEVLPATKQGVLSDTVKVVLIGNLVHRDCLLKYMQKSKIVEVIEIPLLDADGKPTWDAQYPTMAHVEAEKEKVLIAGEGMGHVIWAREYLLKEADEADMIIKREDIQYYPLEWLQRAVQRAGVGIDLAISEKETADYTAMTKGLEVNSDEGQPKLLILPSNFKGRVGFADAVAKAGEIREHMPHGTKWYVEKVGYQQAFIETLEKNSFIVVPMTVTKDKRARAMEASQYIKSGRVLFPEVGAESLIENILGFGIEAHDDEMDSAVHLINGMCKSSGGLIFG